MITQMLLNHLIVFNAQLHLLVLKELEELDNQNLHVVKAIIAQLELLTPIQTFAQQEHILFTIIEIQLQLEQILVFNAHLAITVTKELSCQLGNAHRVNTVLLEHKHLMQHLALLVHTIIFLDYMLQVNVFLVILVNIALKVQFIPHFVQLEPIQVQQELKLPQEL